MLESYRITNRKQESKVPLLPIFVVKKFGVNCFVSLTESAEVLLFVKRFMTTVPISLIKVSFFVLDCTEGSFD